jgi:hypothetical protein
LSHKFIKRCEGAEAWQCTPASESKNLSLLFRNRSCATGNCIRVMWMDVSLSLHWHFNTKGGGLRKQTCSHSDPYPERSQLVAPLKHSAMLLGSLKCRCRYVI